PDDGDTGPGTHRGSSPQRSVPTGPTSQPRKYSRNGASDTIVGTRRQPSTRHASRNRSATGCDNSTTSKPCSASHAFSCPINTRCCLTAPGRRPSARPDATGWARRHRSGAFDQTRGRRGDISDSLAPTSPTTGHGTAGVVPGAEEQADRIAEKD